MNDVRKKPAQRYKHRQELIRKTQPKVLLEVGTHSGRRTADFLRVALELVPDAHYIGYDLWQDLTPEVKKAERDGKKIVTIESAKKNLDVLKKMYPNFTYELIRGNTNETLNDSNNATDADFVFIDGGHSIATIQSDYDALKHNDLIVFDDYYEPNEEGVCVHDIELFGCNAVVEKIDGSIIMPAQDHVKAGGHIRFVLVDKNGVWDGNS